MYGIYCMRQKKKNNRMSWVRVCWNPSTFMVFFFSSRSFVSRRYGVWVPGGELHPVPPCLTFSFSTPPPVNHKRLHNPDFGALSFKIREFEWYAIVFLVKRIK